MNWEKIKFNVNANRNNNMMIAFTIHVHLWASRGVLIGFRSCILFITSGLLDTGQWRIGEQLPVPKPEGDRRTLILASKSN